jgi:guanylate kinase
MEFYNENTFKTDQELIVKDPLYAVRMFDVFGWWQQLGRNKFKNLELCALIVLAKPIHNGFQERVFSRGTFTDDQLRRKMKESTFELSILEAINCDVVDRYMKTYKQKATKEVVAENVTYFWSSNKYLEDNSKPNLSDDD